MTLRITTRTQQGDYNEDRLVVINENGRTLFVIADGAGGSGGGGDAADMACRMCSELFRASTSSDVDWTSALADMDLSVLRSCDGGETTLVVIEYANELLRGASVGDSCAWLVHESDTIDLTKDQKRKPLLGSGEAIPVRIRPVRPLSRLLMGSDGLFKYCPHTELDKMAKMNDPEAALDAMLRTIQLTSGQYQDDVAIILCDFRADF
jgi:PPM family protein phosphatase